MIQLYQTNFYFHLVYDTFADICQTVTRIRHIRTSNSPFRRIWGEWPLLRKDTKTDKLKKISVINYTARHHRPPISPWALPLTQQPSSTAKLSLDRNRHTQGQKYRQAQKRQYCHIDREVDIEIDRELDREIDRKYENNSQSTRQMKIIIRQT